MSTRWKQTVARLPVGRLGLLLLLMLLTACGSEFVVEPLPASQTPAAPAAPAPAPEEAAAPAAEQPTRDYVYTSIGKRDPFRSVFDDVGGEEAIRQAETILGPLQAFDVNSFTVSAVVWGISSPTAMVQAPDGKTHIVKVGTLMGRNWGRVIKILRDGIVILEQSPLPDGTKVSNLVDLKLPVKTIKGMEDEVDLDVLDRAEQQPDLSGIDGL